MAKMNGKATPVLAALLIALALACQTVVQVVTVGRGQEKAVETLSAGQAGIIAEQRKTRVALNSLTGYVRDGVLSKAEAGYLWRKREREEIVPIFRRLRTLEVRQGIVYGPYVEPGIDLPGWDESRRAPSQWLDDKASGE